VAGGYGVIESCAEVTRNKSSEGYFPAGAPVSAEGSWTKRSGPNIAERPTEQT